MRSVLPKKIVLAFVCFYLLAPSAFAEDWLQFRGPQFGACSASDLPVEWSAENIVWKTDLPGPGSSCPVTFGERIYLTSYTGYGVDRKNPGDPSQLTRHVLCINSNDGKIVWQKTIDTKSSKNVYNQWAVALHGYASSTPAVDESGVYVFFGAAGCFAFDHDGEQQWEVDCGSRNHMFGSGTSPVIYNDLVIVNASPENGDLIAINKSTGKEVWRQSGINESWNTPAIYQNENGATELAVSIKGKVLAFKPEDGTPLWSCQAIADYICPSIVAHEGIIFAIGGRKNKTIAIRSGGSGDVSDTHKLWELPKGSNVCSPVIREEHLYWSSEKNGIVYCANLETGELVYEQRLTPTPGLIYASPLLAGGNLYYVSREKGTFVVEAKPEFKLIARNLIESDKSIFNANPVPSGNGFLLRSDKSLYYVRN